jgi:hypothetical protein
MPRSDDERIGRTDPLRDRAMVARSDKVLKKQWRRTTPITQVHRNTVMINDSP